MKWNGELQNGRKVRNLRRTGRNERYPWDGEWCTLRGEWVTGAWDDAGRNRSAWDGGYDLVPADEPAPKTETYPITGTITFTHDLCSAKPKHATDCTICEQSEPVDADGICEHCRERLNGLGYFKNAQAIGMAEQLGTLKGLIEHLAEKCK